MRSMPPSVFTAALSEKAISSVMRHRYRSGPRKKTIASTAGTRRGDVISTLSSIRTGSNHVLTLDLFAASKTCLLRTSRRSPMVRWPHAENAVGGPCPKSNRISKLHLRVASSLNFSTMSAPARPAAAAAPEAAPRWQDQLGSAVKTMAMFAAVQYGKRRVSKQC